MTETEWLQSLKAGDEVYVNPARGDGPSRPRVVCRTTKTMIVVSDGLAEQVVETIRATVDGVTGTVVVDTWGADAEATIRNSIQARIDAAAAKKVNAFLTPKVGSL